MGCFSVFPCFTTSKHRNLKKSVNPTTSPSSVDQGNEKNCDSVLITLPTEESTNLGPIIRDNSEDHLIDDSDNKAVTINLDVETNADNSIVKDEILSVGTKKDQEENVREESGKLVVLVQLENEKERENQERKPNGKLGDLVQIENEMEKEKEKHKNVEVHVEHENQKEVKEEDEVVGVHIDIRNENKIVREPKEENHSLGVHVVLENERDGEKEMKTEINKNEVQSRAFSDSSVSSYISYPPMHRYHNCVINEDEDEALIREDSSESLFSLSINPRRQSKSCPVEVNDDKEVNSPLKSSCLPELNAKSTGHSPDESDNNQSIDSLLNPIENLAQWKTLKARPMPNSDQDQEKENVYLEQEETHIIIPLSEDPSFKVSDRKGKLKTDSAVTTSLSSWLIEPEKTPTVSKEESQYSAGNSYSYSDGATSWKSFEDRPILGAWTIDEVKQVSARSSPRKSPCRNPDETPIIGTVGSYWSHTGQATDSSNSYSSPIRMSGKSRRYREKKASSCHSSPLKRRLGRALDE